MIYLSKWFPALALCLAFSGPVLSQRNVQPAASQQAADELRTARALKTARANPLELRAFLVGMPKGADLHNHLSGAVYAESWIRAATEDQLCVNLATLSFDKAAPQAACENGKVPAERAYKDQHLYDALVDAFS